jgi:hypothetical protein
MASMAGGFRNTQQAKWKYVLTIGQCQVGVGHAVLPVEPIIVLDADAEVTNHRTVYGANLCTGATSQLSRITPTTKGPLTNVLFLGQNYDRRPKSKVGGGKKCEPGQHFMISSRKGVRSLSRSSRGHLKTSCGIGLTERSCKPEPLA